MFFLRYIFLYQYVTLIVSQQNVVIKPDQSQTLDIEPLSVNIRIPNLNLCQPIHTDDCKSLTDQIIKCQQIIFTDPGFSYQQYKGNIDVHRQILTKYQSMCEGTQSDYLVNDLF